MIQFSELKIDATGKCLIVDASISNLDYFERRYITDIFIDSDLTFNTKDLQSDNAIHIEFSNTTTKSFYKQFSIAELSSIINKSDKDLKDHLFFVYIYIDGPVTGTIPCGMDEDLYVGVAINWDDIYHKGLQAMKQMRKDCCDIPKEFIDYILRVDALDLSAKTAHYEETLYYWKKFFVGKGPIREAVCGCNK